MEGYRSTVFAVGVALAEGTREARRDRPRPPKRCRATPLMSRPTPVKGAGIWSAAARRRFGLSEREEPRNTRKAREWQPARSRPGMRASGLPVNSGRDPKRGHERREEPARYGVHDHDYDYANDNDNEEETADNRMHPTSCPGG